MSNLYFCTLHLLVLPIYLLHRERETDRQTDRQTDRDSDRQTDTDRHRQTEDRQTDRGRQRQTETDRRGRGEREREREGECITTVQTDPGFKTFIPNLRPSEGFVKACPVG